VSYVTNVMVHGRLDRAEELRMAGELNLRSLTPCPADGYEVWWGGGKMPECDIWAGAFNHLDENAFLVRVAAWPWGLGRCEAFVKTEDDGQFRVFRLVAGHFEQVLDAPDRFR
jgi:hypothetical protein